MTLEEITKILEVLYKRKNIIKSEIEIIISKKRSYLEQEMKIKSLREELLKLNNEITYYEQELMMNLPPVKTNGIIDLRTKDNLHYGIYISGTKEYIGVISYQGYHVKEFGDIGYYIDKHNRGHHYAYYALLLLSEILNEKGIKDFWICAYKDNSPSIKTIEHYGGTIIEENLNKVFYLCQTKSRSLSLKLI